MTRIPTLLSAALTALAMSTIAHAVPIPDDAKINGFAIGCQAYTFNRFTVFEAIEKTAEAGGKVIEFYPGQKLSKEEPDGEVGSQRIRTRSSRRSRPSSRSTKSRP